MVLLSCNNNDRNNTKQKIIPEKELIPLLVDIHLAEGMNGVHTIKKKHDLNKKTLYKMVLEKHGYSKAEFDSTLVLYSQDKPEKLIKIYEKVMEELSRIEGETSDRLSKEKNKK